MSSSKLLKIFPGLSADDRKIFIDAFLSLRNGICREKESLTTPTVSTLAESPVERIQRTERIQKLELKKNRVNYYLSEFRTLKSLLQDESGN